MPNSLVSRPYIGELKGSLVLKPCKIPALKANTAHSPIFMEGMLRSVVVEGSFSPIMSGEYMALSFFCRHMQRGLDEQLDIAPIGHKLTPPECDQSNQSATG